MNLNKQIRQDIVTAAASAKFDPVFAEIKRARTNIADEIYNHLHADDEKRIKKAAPEGWYATINKVRIVKLTGFTSTMYKKEMPPKEVDCELIMSNRRPYSVHQNALEFKPNPGSIFNAELEAVRDKEIKARADKLALEADLRAIVNSANTLKQLKQIWPEGEAYFPEEVKKTGALVPVDAIKKVNEKLGLPK